MKIMLGPLEASAARVLADRRHTSVEGLVSDLIREEAVFQVGRMAPANKTAQSREVKAQPSDSGREGEA